MLTVFKDWIRKALAWRGPRPETLEEWGERHRSVVRETLALVERWIPEEGVVLDVGANIGLFTEELRRLRPGVQCHLFEPVAHYFQECEQRFQGASEVHLWPLALSNVNEERPIFKAKHNPGANSVVPEIMFDRRENAMVQPDTVVEEEPIRCVRFSDFAPANGIDEVAFIKIDTEGFDYAVLQGLRDFLAGADRLPPILTELLSEDYHPLWDQQHAALEALFALGYTRFEESELPKVGDVLLLPETLGRSFILPEGGHA